jgi:hypothetical protein
MADAGECGSDEAQSREKGNRVKGELTKEQLRQIEAWLKSQPNTLQRGAKYTKANTLRTQQAIARFGKGARHPVCQAGLRLWQLDAELSELSQGVVSREELLNRVKQQKREAGALYRQFCKEEKEKAACRVSVLFSEIGKNLLKVQECYQAAVKLRSIHQKLRGMAVARYEREHDVVVRAKDTKASRALDRVHKRWSGNPNAKGARLKVDDQRTLEILKMLHDRVMKATFWRDGAAAGYWEAGAGGDRPLSDEVWQGRLTVREIHSRLMTVGGSRLAGDKDAKEIRRLLTRLGIRPAEDQLGRKWKPPFLKKQEPKRPHGRPRTKPEIKSMSLEAIQAMLAKTAKQGDGLRNQQIYKAGDESELKWARKVLKSIDREIAQLVQRRGGRRGKFVY